MACMTRESGDPFPAAPTLTQLGEDDRRRWREVRLAALTDSPGAFGSAVVDEQAIAEGGWRELVRNSAVFVAMSGTGWQAPWRACTGTRPKTAVLARYGSPLSGGAVVLPGCW